MALLLVLHVPRSEVTGEGRAAHGPLSRQKVLVGIPFSKNRDKALRIADTFLSTKIIERIQ